jgi:putative restriction endonuclease
LNEPLKRELLKYEVSGVFIEPIYQERISDKKLLIEITEQILEDNFPESLHDDIIQAVGFDLSQYSLGRRPRNPKFRERVMRAYEYRCAVCGFDVRLNDSSVGLEAAHIKWHQAGGPDTENNGFALCVLHHKIFDLGGFTINEEMRVLVSQCLYGRQGFEENFSTFHKQSIICPQDTDYHPKQRYLEWHKREVFKEPSR